VIRVARKPEPGDAGERAEQWLGRDRSRAPARVAVGKLLDARQAPAAETVPAFRREAFECTFCAVFASHSWTNLVTLDALARAVKSPIWYAICSDCKLPTYWMEGAGDLPARMLWPARAAGPPPHEGMPDDVRGEYEEARGIVLRSPRGAAALLRLALQRLMSHGGQAGEELVDGHAMLVEKHLDPRIEQALKSLRVIGNDAVPPGELSPKDDRETAEGLFTVLNFLVEEVIEVPRRLDAMYALLSEGARGDREGRHEVT
jgi:hypothetical protein